MRASTVRVASETPLGLMARIPSALAGDVAAAGADERGVGSEPARQLDHLRQEVGTSRLRAARGVGGHGLDLRMIGGLGAALGNARVSRPPVGRPSVRGFPVPALALTCR